MWSFYLHGLSSSNEAINVNLYSSMTLHFAWVYVICIEVVSILSEDSDVLEEQQQKALTNIIFILRAEKDNLMRKRTHSASCAIGTGSVRHARWAQNGFQMKVVATPCAQGLLETPTPPV